MALIQVDLATGEAALSDGDGGPLRAWEILLDAVTGPTQPADAPVALVTGVVGGLPGPGLARTAAIGLSPLSGAVAETRAEGPFAAGLRRAGVAGVVLHGKATEPVVVVVEDGRARLEPATGPDWSPGGDPASRSLSGDSASRSLSGDSADRSRGGGPDGDRLANYWPDGLVGLETGAATSALAQRYGADAAVAVIGPAAWRGVRYASVVTCRDHPLPRLGFGAVLAAKRVAAVVCRGSAVPAVADPGASERIARGYAAAVRENPLSRHQHGVPGFGVWSGPPGYAAVAGFADTSTPSGLEPADAPPVQRVAACPGCPTECIKVFAGAPLHQEALAMLGAHLGAGTDPFALNARCLQLGVDPVSFAGTAAAAGIAPADVAAALEDLAAGDRLGLGNGAAALEGARHPAMVSKRVELPPFDPRVQPNLGLGYAVAPIGPRYDIVEHDVDFDPDEGMPHCFPEARALGLPVPRPRGALDPESTAVLLRLWSGLDALGVCLFAATPTRPLTLALVQDLVAAVTGERPDVLALGQRRLALQRAVNQRLGIGLEQDTLPDRFFTEPVAAGPYQGSVLDREAFHAAVSRLHTLLEFH